MFETLLTGTAMLFKDTKSAVSLAGFISRCVDATDEAVMVKHDGGQGWHFAGQNLSLPGQW